MTDVPLPGQGTTSWYGWATEQETLSDAAREIVSGRLTEPALDTATKSTVFTAVLIADAVTGQVAALTWNSTEQRLVVTPQ